MRSHKPLSRSAILLTILLFACGSFVWGQGGTGREPVNPPPRVKKSAPVKSGNKSAKPEDPSTSSAVPDAATADQRRAAQLCTRRTNQLTAAEVQFMKHSAPVNPDENSGACVENLALITIQHCKEYLKIIGAPPNSKCPNPYQYQLVNDNLFDQMKLREYLKQLERGRKH